MKVESESERRNIHVIQAQYADNQRFFKNSEEAEFFAASCLVFSIFYRNFKMAGCESYEAKSHITLIYGLFRRAKNKRVTCLQTQCTDNK